MKTVHFGIIGAGLMGREFASAAARWAHLPDMQVRPEIVAVCDNNPVVLKWYRQNFPAIRLFTADYRELLADTQVAAVYCAVPHNLHAGLYFAIIQAGKHLMGEKPFGIDKTRSFEDSISSVPSQFSNLLLHSVFSGYSIPLRNKKDRICSLMRVVSLT